MENEIIRAYHRSDRAFYAKVCGYTLPDIMFGDYGVEGGTDGEMNMVWEILDGEQIARLKVFSDAFVQLHKYSDVLAKLALFENKNFTDDQFCAILDECGFKDITTYTNEKK